ncbi:ABC transporter ATP-binding protein [Neorhizobium sp. NPDC001467]|uniref:ABC transporter ATP-binding protein n=1 Tax=Neorhizobium sp. NPDC001467 TaxID=3390595 RepID=UPI003CFF1A40
MTDLPAALMVNGLRTRYGTRDILKGLDLTIEAGEIFGLLGPNGAGKTTLVRAICGRLLAAAGVITVAGQPAKRSLHRIGLVPQEIALYPHLTVLENLEVFGRLCGLGRRGTKLAVDEIAGATRLEGRLNERVATLSGGWKRRVNIAAALLQHPALLVLDEPTVGVDLEARTGLEALLSELGAGGIGILLITHDLQQVEAIAHKVGFLNNGVIDLQGDPRALIETAFPGQSEIGLTFGRPPSPEQQASMRQLGFSVSHDGLNWRMIGRISLPELSDNLARAALQPKEMSVRKPSLETLVARVTDLGQVRSGGLM